MNKAAQELGRLKAGIKEKHSALKKVTSAANGKLGGRPKKVAYKPIEERIVIISPEIVESYDNEGGYG